MSFRIQETNSEAIQTHLQLFLITVLQFWLKASVLIHSYLIMKEKWRASANVSLI